MENNQFIKLGSSELLVSSIGIGAMTWGDNKSVSWYNPARLAYGLSDTKENLGKAIEVSIRNNVNFIDTAAMYGSGVSEKYVGELTADKRMIIATKFPSSFLPWKADLTKDLNNSLNRLGGKIDLYQVHYPFKWISIPKVMNQMADAYVEGKIKAIGVSNFSADQMRLAHEVLKSRGLSLSSNQVQYSLLHRDPENNGILSACKELGITLIAYMPLAMGALTGKYNSKNRPTGFRRLTPIFNRKGMLRIETIIPILSQIAGRYGKTPSQVALRWLIEQGNVLPIPGAKRASQALENAGALTFSLSPDEVEQLNKL